MRKMLLAAALALAIGRSYATAEARTLEEILRQKGVITEEDYREATRETDTPSYTPGRGITVSTRDGKTTAHVGGRLQVRYTFTAVDDDAAEDDSDFSIRRMKLWLQGHVFSPNLLYKFQGSIVGSAELEDAYAGYRFAPALTVYLGQFKPPQARQELTSSGSLLFVDRSLANDTFNLGRDIGLMAEGGFADGLVAYRAGIFNGNGPNNGNEEAEHLFAARIDIHPFGEFKMDEVNWVQKDTIKAFQKDLRLNIGASVATQTMVPADAGNVHDDNDVLDRALNIDGLDGAAFSAAFGDELDWTLWTANLHAQVGGFTYGGEYYRLKAEPAIAGDWDADGYYVQGAYQILPSTLEVAARYSAIRSTDATAPSFARFDQAQTQFGINYYYQKHHAKLQADYTLVEDDLRANRDDTIFRLQAQVIF